MISNDKDMLSYFAGQSLQGIRAGNVFPTKTPVCKLVLKDAKEVLRALKDFTVCENCGYLKSEKDVCGGDPEKGTCENWRIKDE